MKTFATIISCLVLSLTLTGCHTGAGSSAAAATIKPGMTAEQIRGIMGNPLITATNNSTIPGQEKSEERWTYRAGNDGLIIIMDKGVATSVTTQPNKVEELRAKVKEGMSMQEIIAALGPPSAGYSAKDPNPNQHWVYTDPVAPVQTLNIDFQNGKAVKVAVMDNAAYVTGGNGQPGQ